MLINFCFPELCKNVGCSEVYSDGYEPTNLISTCLTRRNKGFLAESFKSPPVILGFSFICEIDINHIVILPTVGSQKSIGITVAADNSSSSGVLKHSENGFVFHRHGDSLMNKLSDYYTTTMSFQTMKSSDFFKTNFICVNLFKTLNSTIPSLGKIEIWGQPSQNSPRSIVDSVYKTWHEICCKQNNFSKSFLSFNNQCLESTVPSVTSSENICNKKSDFTPITEKNSDNFLSHINHDIVPEEFIDPITCEVMTVPFILPCGKIIDLSTLEKHKEAESKWGRGASDPFTGLLLTERNKTVFASDLKMRIDKFLSEHSNEDAFKSLPRTVGRKLSYNKPPSGTSFSEKKVSEPNLISQTGLPFQDIGLHSHQNKRARKSENIVNRQNSLIETKFSDNRKPLQSRDLTYEEKNDLALERALKLTLASLPCYSNAKLLPEKTTKCDKCCSEDNLFQLPCSHLLCRICLLAITKSKFLRCVHCQADFKTSEPKRFHL